MLTGTCSDCHRVTSLVEGPLPPGTAVSSLDEGVPDSKGPADTPNGPECAECGSPLSISARDDGMLEVSCAECETTTTFVPEHRATPAGPPGRGERYERPRRREESRGEGGSNARPCRQCGAPLKFTTDAEGMLTGECGSCGNRFTLPPRRDSGFGRSDRGGGIRYGARGPTRYGQRPGGWSGRARPGGRPRYGDGSGEYRRRERTSYRETAGNDDRRRKRPRREE